MKHRRRLAALGVLLTALLVAPVVGAQQQTGRIDGVVSDASGAVVPGATIVLSGATAQLETTTGPNGDYHFLNLSPGTYAVTAKLPGFAEVSRGNVIVQTGGSTQIDLQMRPAGVTEAVTVTGASPVVDIRRTSNEVTFDQTQLQEIPTARDPWVLLQQVPGVLVDRVNVGGNESGQQSTFIRGASNGSDTMWNLDGVMITDPASIGSTPTYYDFDAFQEVQFTTGGNDIRQQTGGIGINFVTKRGTNQFKGSSRLFFTNDSLQSKNVPDSLVSAQPTFGHACTDDATKRCANEIKRVADFGVEIGGPLVKDKLWFWGAAAKNDIKNIVITGFPDDTQLIDYNAKLDWQADQASRVNFLYFRGDKRKQGRSAALTRPPETTHNQTGPTDLFKVEDAITLGNSTFIAARYAFVNGAFTLSPQGGTDQNIWYEGGSGTWHGSYYFYDTSRPQHQFQVDGNHFMGKQELKFGFQYRHTIVNSLTAWPGNQVIADVDNELAYVTRGGATKMKEQIMSGYVGDTLSWNRLTASFNLRWDRQWGNNEATQTPANAIFPDLLPALSFPGGDTAFTWNDFSPRVGITVALDDTRKTVLRANVARYASQIYTGLISFNNPLYTIQELDYGWADANHDRVVQRSELDFNALAGSYYVDPDNPTSIVAPNRIDSDLTSPHSTEFILGVDRELFPNFAIGAAFSMGRTTDPIWWPLVGITQADFVANATPVTGTIAGSPYSATWYRLRAGVHPLPGNAQIETNRPGYDDRYTGFQLTANKRLANRWMMKGSFAWNNPTRHFGDPAVAIQNPTSTQSNSGASGSVTGPFSGPTEQDSPIAVVVGGGSGAKGDVFINSRWQFNVAGMVQLGGGVNVAANFLGRQGYPNLYYHQIGNPDLYSTFIRVKPFVVDEFRNPDLYTLDGRVEKEIKINRTKLVVLAEAFNLLNKSDTLQVNNRTNTATANQIREILSPRIVRFGVRYVF